MKQLFPILLAFVAGGVLPIQAGLNVELGKSVQQPVFAAFASFLVGSIGLLIYLFMIKHDFSTTSNVKEVHWSVWMAGLLGAFYVAAVIILTPKLGTALTFALIVTGQMAISLIVDQFGFMGANVHHINWQRTAGVVLLIAGVILIRKF